MPSRQEKDVDENGRQVGMCEHRGSTNKESRWYKDGMAGDGGRAKIRHVPGADCPWALGVGGEG